MPESQLVTSIPVAEILAVLLASVMTLLIYGAVALWTLRELLPGRDGAAA